MNSIISQEPVNSVSGIGPRAVSALKRLGITTIWDLILHFPTGYQDRSQITPIAELSREGEYAVIKGTISRTAINGTGKNSIFNIFLSDSTGTLRISIFHFKPYQLQQITQEQEICVYGKISFFNGQPQMTNPEFFNSHENQHSFTPVYGLTHGIKMTAMRKYIDSALAMLNSDNLAELIPENLITEHSGYTLRQCFQKIHHPDISESLLKLAEFRSIFCKRIILEELTAHQLSLIKLREMNNRNNGLAISPIPKLMNKFVKSLPFKPTGAQLRVTDEIIHDLGQNIPMNRLVQGDVGAGKTLVAAMAALTVVGNGYQAAIMAPTEILAEQHAEKISKMFESLNIKTATLLGKYKAAQKKTQLKLIESGEAGIIIGTHAIFQDAVHYANLKLIVIDEQHRFGVDQRLKLRSKAEKDGITPHVLAMTATPIPRTLAQTMYADMKVSVLDELPPGRTPIKTFMLSTEHKNKLLPRIMENCQKHLQVYWVCCLVNESDTLEECQDTENARDYLQTNLPDLKIDIVHGQMKAAEKEAAMIKFKKGETDILVATSVIEVGVDVPNAFLIVIENAERYGLAQLHQLRGRVGRGKIESYCCLLCSDSISPAGIERMEVLKESSDGFYIAEKDLEIRGPGDLMGTRQTGEMIFKAANLFRDQDLLEQAATIASSIHSNYPEHETDLLKRWYPDGETASQA